MTGRTPDADGRGPTAEQQAEIDRYLRTYREMAAFVPPRVQARFERLGRTNPELLLAQERSATSSRTPTCWTRKRCS